MQLDGSRVAFGGTRVVTGSTGRCAPLRVGGFGPSETHVASVRGAAFSLSPASMPATGEWVSRCTMGRLHADVGRGSLHTLSIQAAPVRPRGTPGCGAVGERHPGAGDRVSILASSDPRCDPDDASWWHIRLENLQVAPVLGSELQAGHWSGL